MAPSFVAKVAANSSSFLYFAMVRWNSANSSGDIFLASLASSAIASAFFSASAAESRSPYLAPEKPWSACSARARSTRAAVESLVVAWLRMRWTVSRSASAFSFVPGGSGWTAGMTRKPPPFSPKTESLSFSKPSSMAFLSSSRNLTSSSWVSFRMSRMEVAWVSASENSPVVFEMKLRETVALTPAQSARSALAFMSSRARFSMVVRFATTLDQSPIAVLSEAKLALRSASRSISASSPRRSPCPASRYC